MAEAQHFEQAAHGLGPHQPVQRAVDVLVLRIGGHPAQGGGPARKSPVR